MKKFFLFFIFTFLFLLLSVASVEAAADCPVCPDNYVWSYPYQACYIPPNDYIDPTYIDCGSQQCVKGRGCLPSGCDIVDAATGVCPSNQPIKCPETIYCCPSLNACPAAGGSAAGEPFVPESCTVMGVSGYMTALGCIPTDDPSVFVAWLLKTAIGLAGGIAVLLIIFGGFLIILSSGDPQRLQAGKDILTSAIIGLVVIIFAVFLLRIIGVEILKIPGFE